MSTNIKRPDDLFRQIWKDNKVKIVQTQKKLGQHNFCIIDFSLNAQRQTQKQLYLNSSFYLQNIRLGNTLIEIFQSKGRKRKIQILRKGMCQIFQMELSLFQPSVQTDKNKSQVQKNTPFRHIFHSTFQLIFFLDVLEAFQKQRRVDIIQTRKIKGTIKAQVSYFYDFDTWVICSSKATSLLVKAAKDIQMFKEDQYAETKLIASQWFKEIGHLNKDQLLKLQKRLDGYTLVGQYCSGSSSFHNQIRDYNKIIWFGLVDNFSNKFCYDPLYTKSQIQKFGLSFVKVQKYGSFIKKQDFFQSLKQLYLQIKRSSGFSQRQQNKNMQEGSVIYFTCPQQKTNELCSEVLGAGLMVTLQLEIFQKAKSLMIQEIQEIQEIQQIEATQVQKNKIDENKKKTTQVIQTFQSECSALQIKNKTKAPYPLSYYCKILKTGLQLIKHCQHTKTQKLSMILKNNFSLLIKLACYLVVKCINIEKYGQKMIECEQFLSQLKKIPISKFGPLGSPMKVIYLQVGLPNINEIYLSRPDRLKKYFDKLKLPFTILKAQPASNNNNQTPVDILLKELNNKVNNANDEQGSENQPQQQLLQHFYVEGPLSCQEIHQILQSLKTSSDEQFYHKIILIKDTTNVDCQFQSQGNRYPFTLETIMLSYYITYQEVKAKRTIKEKIDKLRHTTELLSQRCNF